MLSKVRVVALVYQVITSITSSSFAGVTYNPSPLCSCIQQTPQHHHLFLFTKKTYGCFVFNLTTNKNS